MQLAHFSNQTIHDRCQFLVRSERKVTAEILEYIAEIAAREIFLERGYNSLLAYLIKEMGYSKTAALRRMDGAKLLREFPEIKERFVSGSLNLSQASIFAQSLRQKKAEERKRIHQVEMALQGEAQSNLFEADNHDPQSEKHNTSGPSNRSQVVVGAARGQFMFSLEQKKEILDQIQNESVEATQKALAMALDLTPKQNEKRRFQRDHSMRAEITFTPEQTETLERIKQLLSHVHPGGQLSDITITSLTSFWIGRIHFANR